MAMPSYEEYQKERATKRAAEDEQLKALGIVRIGGKTYQVKTPTADSIDAEAIKTKAVAEAAGKAEAEKLYPTQKPQSSTAKLEEKTYQSIKGFSDELLGRFNEKGDLKGVGFGTGTITDLLYQLGLNNDQEGSMNRIALANIKGTLAKLRGGTSFTPNEEKMLDRYTPSENDSPKKIKDKLNGLQNYLKYRAEVAGVDVDAIDNPKPKETGKEDEIDSFLKGF
jgi:hypothetical protein